MTITTIPNLKNPSDLKSHLSSKTPLFIAFIASKDPQTNEPWCPDVRAALPIINKVFSEEATDKELLFLEVGVRNEWKDNPENHYRKNWDIEKIPTIIKYILQEDGDIKTERLVEDEAKDEGKVVEFRDS